MFETLYRLSRQVFPVTVSDRREIEKLRRLEAAGYIQVHIPGLHADCDDCIRQDPAKVLGITPLGWSVLSRGSGAGGSSTMRRASNFTLGAEGFA
jgi:hypothetical protein